MDKDTKNIKFAIYGYSFIDYKIIKNKNFQQCLEILPEYSSYFTAPMKEELVPKISEKLVNNYFPKLNKNIDILTDEKFDNLYKNIFPMDDSSIKEFITAIRENVENKNIYSLPIKYIDGYSLDGKINKPIFYTKNLDILKDYKLVFSSIELGSKIDYLSLSTHIHEVIHGLLERNKGSVKNYLNAEVLSIFMEKISASDIAKDDDLLLISETNRLGDLRRRKDNLTSVDNFFMKDSENFQYLYSGFLAEYLFDLYYEGNNFVKKEILYEISKILDGSLQLEDFLRLKEASYDNMEVVKTLKKVIDNRTFKLR